MRHIKYLFFIFLLTLFTACDDNTGSEKVDFDREAFLVNMADNVIKPSILNFASEVEGISVASSSFATNPSLESLNELRSEFKEAWLAYQHLAFVHVGPVSSVNLRDRVNIFPTNTELIEQNINNQDYIIGSASNVAAKGFPAIDYLLFGTGASQEEVLSYFGDPDLGESRLKYLSDVIADIQTASNIVSEGWDPYRETFISNIGTDVGSGTSLLVNEYNFQFDIRLKNAKIGFPSGGNPRTGGIVSPQSVEAYFSGWSGDLAKESVKSSIEVFKGQAFNSTTDGLGMDDYLDALNAIDRNENPLSTSIINESQAALDLMESINAPYSELAANEGSNLVEVYNQLQIVIPLIKVDMTSALSVSITFQDNDGD
ncbi:imelysin family protein [Marivirga arenosa]|uniref:Imelysin family protein n=1 Tax=Marivirga arenosa TaxID=3059076 RepID=A0AA51ZW90_9BACT|nr:imelysin family protein [Marivirga sp. BKB1-2]WNB17881.1 imelysin family protein [Marivirga sp. BKB1-2]